MFKLIGIIVIAAIVFIGYPAISRWYAGEATPQETVNDVRNRVGSALITDGKTAEGAHGQNQAAPQAAPAPSAAPAAQPQNSQMPMSASELTRSMMKN